MDIVQLLQEATAVGPASWRLEIGDEIRLARAFELRGDDPGKMRLAQVAGVAPWVGFSPLDEAARRRLDISDELAVVAVRPWVSGMALPDVIAENARRWLDIGLRLTGMVRGLHAQHARCGILNPGRVIVTAEKAVRLVGVPPFLHCVIDSDHNSPFGAPERTNCRGLSRPQDIYSLGALICWIAAGGHGSKADRPKERTRPRPTVPETVDRPVASVLERCLADAPEARPSADQVYEVLSKAASPAPAPFLTLPPGLYRGLERDVCDEIEAGSQTVVLEGQRDTGKTFALRRLAARLESRGWNAVLASPDSQRIPVVACRHTTSLDGGPFEPLRRMLDHVSPGSEPEKEPAVDQKVPAGDLFSVFDYWLRRLQGAAADGRIVVLWDDFDVTAPDVRAFWQYVLHRADTEVDLRFVCVTTPGECGDMEATRLEVVGPGNGAWGRWRKRTIFNEVRSIPESRWQDLVERWGRRPVALLEAINDEIGSDKAPGFARRWSPTQAEVDTAALFAGDWRRHIEELISCGAFIQAAQTCRRIDEVLARSSHAKRLEVLQLWLEAIVGAGTPPQMVRPLIKALQEADGADRLADAGDRAAILRARLYWRLHQYDRGLSVLAESTDVDDRDRHIQWFRWRAELLLASGRIDQAIEVARRGATSLQWQSASSSCAPAPVHLEMVQCAGRAISGDDEAVDELLKLAVRLRDAGACPKICAQCHRRRAVARERRGSIDAAVDARLRALEIMQSAGRLAQLSRYLLDVGSGYRRRGHLGVAVEYLEAGIGRIHSGTSPQIRVLLYIHQGEIALATGRVDEAAAAVDSLLELLEEVGPQLRARGLGLAGDVACEAAFFDKAHRYYEQGLVGERSDIRTRVRISLKKAQAFLENGRVERAQKSVDEARDLVEKKSLAGDELRVRLNIVETRIAVTGGDDLEQISGAERLGRYLRQGVDEGHHQLVLAQIRRLWNGVDSEVGRGLAEAVVASFERAKTVAVAGLTTRQADEFFTQFPSVSKAVSDEAPVDEIDDEDSEKLRELRRENERLQKQAKRWRRRVQQLERRCQKLQKNDDGAQTTGDDPPARGRRPKAKQQAVIEAFQRCDGDFEATADDLGVSERTLYRYLNRYDIDANQFAPE